MALYRWGRCKGQSKKINANQNLSYIIVLLILKNLIEVKFFFFSIDLNKKMSLNNLQNFFFSTFGLFKVIFNAMLIGNSPLSNNCNFEINVFIHWTTTTIILLFQVTGNLFVFYLWKWSGQLCLHIDLFKQQSTKMDKLIACIMIMDFFFFRIKISAKKWSVKKVW